MSTQSKVTQEILERQSASFDSLVTKRLLYDDVEKLFHGQLNDAISTEASSKIFDPKLSTLTLERAYRVMAQLPTGKVKGISKNDSGGTQLMNLILDKYVIPNANSQFDFLTKLRMVDLYSNIYGVFYALVDWDVRGDGYVGPDMWLLNIRDVFPQVGAVSVSDSDHIIIRTWKPLSYFENLKKQNGFKNIDQIVTELKKKGGSKAVRDQDAKSKREENQYTDTAAAKNAGYFEVLTQFEKDRWVDICVDANGKEFRDIDNPHDNDELPIAVKYSTPLLDDPSGMGDMERGKSMQMAINANWNLYFDAIKMSIAPPVLINKDNIASPSSIQFIPAAKWLTRGNLNNVAKTLDLHPRGTESFNNTHQVANASILNLFGTTDTTTTQQTDPGLGKTPRALAMQEKRENTRDNADRFYMEMFVTDVMKKFVNLVSKKQSKAITMRLFDDEIEELTRSYPEIQEMYDEKTGKVTIDKSKTGSVLYDYEIVTGSTFAVDQKTQQDNLLLLVEMFMNAQSPQGNSLDAMLQKDGYKFKFGELFKKAIANSGITDWDKILEEMTDEEIAEQVLGQTQQQFMEAVQQMQGAQGGQNLNQVPPVQNGPPNGQPAI